MEDQGTHTEVAPAESQRTVGARRPQQRWSESWLRTKNATYERSQRNTIAKTQSLWTREEERRPSELHQKESERHIAEMHRQMEWLQHMFTEISIAAASVRGRGITESIKQIQLIEEDNIKLHLTTFERVMKAQEVHCSWKAIIQQTKRIRVALLRLLVVAAPRQRGETSSSMRVWEYVISHTSKS